jgi:hypothetical protein
MLSEARLMKHMHTCIYTHQQESWGRGQLEKQSLAGTFTHSSYLEVHLHVYTYLDMFVYVYMSPTEIVLAVHNT